MLAAGVSGAHARHNSCKSHVCYQHGAKGNARPANHVQQSKASGLLTQ